VRAARGALRVLGIFRGRGKFVHACVRVRWIAGVHAHIRALLRSRMAHLVAMRLTAYRRPANSRAGCGGAAGQEPAGPVGHWARGGLDRSYGVPGRGGKSAGDIERGSGARGGRACGGGECLHHQLRRRRLRRR
jgi:hypothetical protein